MKWTVGLRACFNLVKRDSLEGRSAFSFPWYATQAGWHSRLLPGSMKFRIRREEWILNAFVDQASSPFEEKVAKACNRPAWTPSGAASCVEIGRVIFLTFPSPKVPISLVTINCFSINRDQEEKFEMLAPRRWTFFQTVSQIFVSETRIEDRFVFPEDFEIRKR